MDETAGGRRGWRQAWPQRAAAVAVTIAIALQATACASSPAGTSVSGVSNVPPSTGSASPSADGGAPSTGSASPSAGGSARQSGSAPPAAGTKSGGSGNEWLPTVQCMRSHGLPNFPEPGPNDRPTDAWLAQHGVDTSSPQFQAASRACASLFPGRSA